MLQSLAQFGVALLDLFEQPDVLDRDYRLVGKGFEKSDLLFCKGTNFGSTDHDAPIAIPSRNNGVARTVRVPIAIADWDGIAEILPSAEYISSTWIVSRVNDGIDRARYHAHW